MYTDLDRPPLQARALNRSPVPPWLDLDVNDKKGTVRGLPLREDIQIPVQEQLIVELFSK